MPVLAADAPAARYRCSLGSPDARFAAAMTTARKALRQDRARLAQHLGSRMANTCRAHPQVPLAGWISLSISSGASRRSSDEIPVFDVYAENDLDAVVQGAPKGAAVLKRMRGSSQHGVPTGSFFRQEGKGAGIADRAALEGGEEIAAGARGQSFSGHAPAQNLTQVNCGSLGQRLHCPALQEGERQGVAVRSTNLEEGPMGI